MAKAESTANTKASPTGPVGPTSIPRATGCEDRFGGARAVEVAALLGDSVVGVKHVMNPRGGRVTAVTYALFGLGSALLLAAALAFISAVGTAKLNQEALRIHTEELKLPQHEFRPRPVNPAYDWLAFGGLAGAITCFAWGLVRLRNERVSPSYRIGSAPEVDFPLDSDAFSESFPLVAPMGDDFALNFRTGMNGELTVAGTTTPLDQLATTGMAAPSTSAADAWTLRIPERARIRLTSGKNTFLVSSVAAPRRHPAPLFASLSTTVLAFLAGSAILHLGLWALLRTVPPDPKSLSLGLGGDDARLTRATSKATEEPLDDLDAPTNAEQSLEEPGGTGTKMALDPGKMGQEDSPRQAGRFAMEDKGVPPQLAKARAMDEARHSGLAGALQGDVFASLTGTADFSSGLDDLSVYGGMIGAEIGEMQGYFGYGVSGFGPGAGGTGWGTIGAGRYGTIGRGAGTGTGYAVGSGAGTRLVRSSKTPDPAIGIPEATTGIDKEIIRRYIRRKLSRIKHCYERQLLVEPSLKGTVVSSFQISPTGVVLGSTAEGVDEHVASCVSAVIETIRFPKPNVGSLVQVRYPFNFRPTGE